MLFVGTKFYKYENDELKMVRIVKYCNKETVSIRDEKTKERMKISIDTLLKEYVKLSVSGVMIFNKVLIGNNMNDIIVTLYRNAELNMKAKLPYCVCRQGIVDIFYQLYNPNKNLYGASISIDTMPSNIEFDIMVACDSVYENSTQYIAVYLNDTLDDIIELIDTKEYDRTLNLMYLDHIQYESRKFGNMFYQNMLKKNECDGYVRSIKDLLDYNNFMFDFYRGFNILPINFDLNGLDQQALPNSYKEILSSILSKNIDQALVMKYDLDIELSLIKKDYILISDKNKELYIIVYNSSGTYQLPVENIINDENLEILHKKMNTGSVQNAYEHIIMNRTKYRK